MSSHHIVRDEQEPALIIHRVDDFPFHYLEQLLEWSPTMICCGPALDYILAQGIKVDIAIVPLEDTDRYQKALMNQQPVKIISLSKPDFMATGLQVLLKDHHHAVNIVTTKELKDEVIDRVMDFHLQFDLVIWDNESRNIILGVKHFTKWIPEETMIKIQPLSEKAHFRTEGFRSDIDQELDDEIKLMKMEEGKISIHCDKPPFMVTEFI